MFSFRNKLSPTTSTLLRLNRSPCTITVHQWHVPHAGSAASSVRHARDLHAALAHDGPAARLREAAAIRLMIELMQDAVARLELDDTTIEASNGAAPTPEPPFAALAVTRNGESPTSTASNGIAASAATLLLAVAGALIAAGALAPKSASVKRLAHRSDSGATTVLPEPVRPE